MLFRHWLGSLAWTAWLNIEPTRPGLLPVLVSAWLLRLVWQRVPVSASLVRRALQVRRRA
jgi:hypothetical protein